MKSVMSHSFSQVPTAQIQRSAFDRSHGYKTTFNSGFLVPVYIDEALPGDTFSLQMTQFARMATPIVPIMDNLFCDTFFFAVPIRLIWENWEKFNGQQNSPGDSTDYLVPQTSAHPTEGYSVGGLSDYLGLPTGVPGLTHSSLWHRAYNLIWNDWFRDENLQEPATVPMGDGPDSSSFFDLKRRGKRHDYFTSALPWPQKGPAVQLPLGQDAPVLGIAAGNQTYINSPTGAMYQAGGHTDASWASYKLINPAEANNQMFVENDGDGFPNIRVDLSEATAATINALRQAFQLQRLYERDARGGTRYTEIIRSHFGVTSPDARLQRPEYLGGGSAPIHINPVAQTSASTEETPQGNLAAFGTLSSSGHGFSKSFTEHCVIIGLVSVRADLNYQQGINRMFSRRTRWDFYWPALAHIGEQAILNKEIYAQGTSTDDEVFGYQERYAEYRYKPSLVTGQFRSTYAQSLDIWHLSQDFVELPVLGDHFIQETPPISRVVAVPSEPEFLFDSYIRLKCVRPMPTYSVPGLIDHF